MDGMDWIDVVSGLDGDGGASYQVRGDTPRQARSGLAFLGNPAQIRSFRFIQVGPGAGGGDEMVVDWVGFGGDMGGFGGPVRGFGRDSRVIRWFKHTMVQTQGDGSSPDVS